MSMDKILNRRKKTVNSWSDLVLYLYMLKGLINERATPHSSLYHNGYGSSITDPLKPINNYTDSILKNLLEYAKELRIRNGLNQEKVEIYIKNNFVEILKNLIIFSQNSLLDILFNISRILEEYKLKYVEEIEFSKDLYGKYVPFAFKVIEEINRKAFEKSEEIPKEELGNYINFLLSLFADFDDFWKKLPEEKLLPLSQCVLEIADYIYFKHKNLPNFYSFMSSILETLSKIKITNPKTFSKKIIEILRNCENSNTSCIEKNLSREIYQ